MQFCLPLSYRHRPSGISASSAFRQLGQSHGMPYKRRFPLDMVRQRGWHHQAGPYGFSLRTVRQIVCNYPSRPPCSRLKTKATPAALPATLASSLKSESVSQRRTVVSMIGRWRNRLQVLTRLRGAQAAFFCTEYCRPSILRRPMSSLLTLTANFLEWNSRL